MQNNDYLETKIKKLKDELVRYFSGCENHFFPLKMDEMDTFTREFIDMFPSRPVKDNVGGGGMIPNYWLFIVAKTLQPTLVVESGVWKGQTSWLLRQACPDAEIHAFDISLKNLEYKDNTISHHEHDWMNSDIKNGNPDKGLVFFDDHINQAKRVREAYKRDFKWLVFDDNVPVDQIHRIGIPPLPTIGMLFDEKLKEGDPISWQLKEKVYKYNFSLKDTYNAKELISNYFVFPTYTYFTLVKLK